MRVQKHRGDRRGPRKGNLSRRSEGNKKELQGGRQSGYENRSQGVWQNRRSDCKAGRYADVARGGAQHDLFPIRRQGKRFDCRRCKSNQGRRHHFCRNRKKSDGRYAFARRPGARRKVCRRRQDKSTNQKSQGCGKGTSGSAK